MPQGGLSTDPYLSHLPPGLEPNPTFPTDGSMQGGYGYVAPQERRGVWRLWKSNYLTLCLVILCLLIFLLGALMLVTFVLNLTGAFDAVVPAPVTTGNSIVPFGQQGTAGNAIGIGEATLADSLKLIGSASTLFEGAASLAGSGGGVALSVDNGDVEVRNGYLHVQGQIGTDTGIVQPSDGRFKRDVVPLDTAQALHDIIMLSPSKYRFVDWWQGDLREDVGFVAQEMEKHAPHAVRKVSRMVQTEHGGRERLDDFRMVDKSALVPQLVGAVKELTDRLIALQKEVGAQKTRSSTSGDTTTW